MRFSLLLLCFAACNGRAITPGTSHPALGSSCRFDAPDDPARVVMAAAYGGQLLFVHADATNHVAYSFEGVLNAGPPSDWSHTVVSRGSLVAGTATSSSTDLMTWRQELVVLDTDGNVQLKQSWDNLPMVTPWLNEEGALALDLGGTDTLLIDAHGERTLAGITPLAEPTAAGDLPAHGASDNGIYPYGWVRAGANALTPLRHPLAGGSSVEFLAGQLVYLGQIDGAVALVSEGPSDERVIALPRETGVDLAMTKLVAPGWVLVGTYQAPLFRVNVLSSEVVQVGINAPAGLRKFQGGGFGPELDSNGALLTPLRDDYSGALYRSTDGTTWSRIGGTISNVLDIVGLERGGTYLVAGTNARYSSEQWSPPTSGNQPDLSGESLQVARPSDSLTRVADGAATWQDLASTQITSDGLCVAYWRHLDDDTTVTLKALDVERGKTFDLLPLGQQNPQVTTWIPGQ